MTIPASSRGITRAISIRQPWVELILRGVKDEEYRTIRTNTRGRVWLYASATPVDVPEVWDYLQRAPGELPTRCIVGSVEIVDCVWSKKANCWAYKLENPKRLRTPLFPKNQPSPVFWIPKF